MRVASSSQIRSAGHSSSRVLLGTCGYSRLTVAAHRVQREATLVPDVDELSPRPGGVTIPSSLIDLVAEVPRGDDYLDMRRRSSAAESQ
jgi:hypothetical protein